MATFKIPVSPDKELNVLIYWTHSYVIIYRSHTLWKMVRFFGPPCIYSKSSSLHGNCYNL